MGSKKIITTPFDRLKIPPKPNPVFTFLFWIISWVCTRRGRLKIRRERMKGLKPPFLVLGSHHSFMDFYVTPLALFPYPANYISELEGFENYGEWFYRQLGCLGTRKFVDDLALIKNIKRVIDRKGILVIYPEARYANVGTNSVLPQSVGKLAKMLKVPVVVINMHGNYLQSPIWNLKTRGGVRLEAEIAQVFTAEELANAALSDVQTKLQQRLSYDEYQWQYQHKMKINYPKRTEGLEMVLYQCIKCGTEFRMSSAGAELFCGNCGSRWYMTDLGRLEHAKDGESLHIPNWYEWQRGEVIREINEGRYVLETPVRIESLPNAKNFIDLGEGFLRHDGDGFDLTFTDYGGSAEKTMHFPAASMSSVHTEYDYRGKGQCITLSTLDNTWFLFPASGSVDSDSPAKREHFNVTKIQFATEYYYLQARRIEE
ncbi:lysophospholipid acyltransferase family protein [Breznakiellaceae bacterium SP9]